MHVVFMFFILFLSIAKAPQRATELSFGRHFHGAFDELACGFTDFSPHFLLYVFGYLFDSDGGLLRGCYECTELQFSTVCFLQLHYIYISVLCISC
jgi:hypothetical protein